jgi:uncharacterized protein DUF2169
MAETPLAVVPLAPIAATTTLWRQRGQLHATVIVETRWKIVPDAIMTSLLPEAPRSVAAQTPMLEQVDVVVTKAHAHAAPSTTPSATAVRLALYRGAAVLDRCLLVYPSSAPDEPTMRPRRFPLQPQRPAVAAVVDPGAPSQAVSLGPIGEQERIAAFGGKAPERRGAVLELSEDLSFAAFQLAPQAQRIAHLQGDEWLVLDGMQASLGRLQSQLPGAVAVARVYPRSGAPFPLALRADRLEIDADGLTCILTWRGNFPLPDEKAAASHTVGVTLLQPGQSPQWPDAKDLAAAGWEPPVDEGTHSDEASTLEMTSEQGMAMRAALGLPPTAANQAAAQEGMPNAVALALEEALRGAPKIPQTSVDKLEITLSDALRRRGGSPVEEFVSSLFYRLEGDAPPEEPPKKK